MKKRIFSIVLVCVLAISVLAGSVVSASADTSKYLGPYTPSAGVETNTYKLAMPGAWQNGTTKSQGDVCGVYWWGGDDKPDEVPAANGHGWPGFQMENDASVVNLRSIKVPKSAPMIIFDNYIDGGMDVNAPEFKDAKQIIDYGCEYFQQGDSDYYSKAFWDYLYDNYYDDFCDNPNLQIAEFGDYAKNFYYDEDLDNICHTADNMVFVVDLNPDHIKMCTTIVPEGMPSYNGAFYFDYGNGEFGLWPTKELLTEHEGVKFDDQGKVITEGETMDKYGFITRKGIDAYDQKTEKDFVVYGNFTGTYWEDKTVVTPTVDPNTVTPAATTVPAADTNDATSAQSGSTSDSAGGNNSNGSIATGDFALPVIIFVAAIAGIGVVYFVRRKRSK